MIQQLVKYLCRRGSMVILLVVPSICSVASAEPFPDVKVDHVRRVFHNGEHNAFTDLVKFRDRFYLTFRSCPAGHAVHPTASVIILASDDGQAWNRVHQFHVPDRDTRDPHFLIFKDRLFVYTGTWYCGDEALRSKQFDLNLHLGYAVWSEDGANWQGPTMLEGTFGHYVWRAAAFGEKAYLCGRRKREFAVGPKGEGRDVESVMLESDDGLVYRKRALFQEEQGDETAFQFRPDGTVFGIGRRGSGTAQFLKSAAPYVQWERTDLKRTIGGPLLTKWGGIDVVGGRKSTDQGPKTFLAWFADGVLHDFAALPSAGDNSYPGFVELDSKHALVSWYSSHEKDEKGKVITAIYLANLEKPF